VTLPAAPAPLAGGGARRPFLTAAFRNLAVFTWRAPAELLRPRLPPGVELDLERDGPHVSLVLLDFTDTRVLGVPWPGYTAFPDVNLRFYVRQGGRRGVVFVRELVPSRLVARIAANLYGEPFEVAEIRSRSATVGDVLVVERRLRARGARHRVRVEADAAHAPIAEGSDAWFLTERSFGFSKGSSSGADRGRVVTRVDHAPWPAHAVRRFELAVDFARLYGPAWGFLGRAPPWSVLLSAGSPVVVSRPWWEPGLGASP
jgi:uncharacterized protein YqjF (DUF2071 family)